MGRCRDPLCVGSDGRRTRYPAWECADGDFLSWRTGCTAWVDSNDCEDDEDEDEHAYALGAVGGHQGGRGRGSTDGDVEVHANMLRALFDGEVPPEAPTLQIDVDALLADEDYMDGE